MFSKRKFIVSARLFLAVVFISLSGCATPTIPPTETKITPTLEVTNTPEQTSNIVTDATLEAQTQEAFEATKTLISSLPNASHDEIVKTLLIKWLNYYKTDKVAPYFRLKDYEIEEVKATSGYCPPPDKDTTKFAARVKFSIQTVTPHPGDWVSLPGDITLDDANWIYHLYPYISISANADTYQFAMEGSIPCS